MKLSRVLMIVCLTTLRWMLWTIAGLLSALIVKDYVFGPDRGLAIPQLSWLTLIALISGWITGALAKRMEREL